ncbi:MAG: L-threonylcarbamoyladenylate synthase [Endozoicomonas sp.]
MSQLNTEEVARVVGRGGVIAYPTEAVWGLGCDPWNREAVHRILDIKVRPVEKGLILVGASEQQFGPLLEPLDDTLRSRLSNTWPGPLTWLIPDPSGWVPEWVRGQFDTVAIRVSNHPLVQALCKTTGRPLVSTSANRAGEEPLLTSEQVSREFGSLVDLIVEGDTGSQSTPSEIRDLQTGSIIRSG